MLSLVYVSSTTSTMDNKALLDILHASHRNNSSLGLTGMLLYKNGNFMQVLEGPEEAVRAMLQKITDDPRHKDVIVLAEDIITERQFSDWKMAFVNLDDESIRNEIAYSQFLQDEFTAEKYRQTPQMAYIMLLSFKETMR